jgi:AraC-like DNA-binding protein
MAQMEVFSTENLAPHRRVDYWNALTADALTALVADPLEPQAFSGRLRRTAVGALRIAEVASDPALVHHTHQHVAQCADAEFLLGLQLDGETLSRQQGREIVLQAGDFTLFDSARPYEIAMRRSNRMLVVCISQVELRRRMANPEAVVGLGMSGASGLSGLLSTFLRRFWSECCRAQAMPVGGRFADALCDFVASAYAELPQARPQLSSLVTARREQVRDYIECHLHDPQLTPTRAAQALRISTRYLHRLFGDGETAACYILRRRLEEAAHALRAGGQQHRTITQLAYQFGFNDPAHFGRAFRERYGVSPREYRQRATLC